MHLNRNILALLSATLLLAACGDADDNGNNNTPDPTPESKITTLDQGQGVFASQVDATDSEEWVYMNLADGDQVDAGADPTASATWDLAFRRSNIKVNGGFSGTGMVEVAAIATDDFDSITVAPTTAYLTDTVKDGVDPDQPDFINDDNTDFVFGRATGASDTGWFNYDPVNHVLSAAAVIYAVRSVSGQYYKLQFLDYYDGAGTSGFPTIRYAEIDAPDPTSAGFELDASDRQAAVYFDLETASFISVSDPATSTEWDLMIRRTSFATNSGASGPGLGGAQWGDEGGYAGAAMAPTVGYDEDKRVPPPGPPVPEDQWIPGNVTLGEWFNYDEATMTVSPKDGFFVIRGADGASYYKLKIYSYEDGIYRVDVGSLQRRPEVRTLSISSMDAMTWNYVSLRTGEVLTDTASTTAEWDIAFSRTLVRTNSGTSGPGTGGAFDIESDDFATVTEAPTGGYVVDEMITPGQPGQPPYSGNAVLGTWFDYDPVNHIVSVRNTVFSIRLADGSYAKLRVDSFDDGLYGLTYVYAGTVGGSFQ